MTMHAKTFMKCWAHCLDTATLGERLALDNTIQELAEARAKFDGEMPCLRKRLRAAEDELSTLRQRLRAQAMRTANLRNVNERLLPIRKTGLRSVTRTYSSEGGKGDEGNDVDNGERSGAEGVMRTERGIKNG